MRLADFIETRLSEIVDEWERFAATLLPAAGGMASLALRDHAQEILRAIAADLRTSQTSDQQRDKSWGQRDAAGGAVHATAAQIHGALRASSGFSIQQLVAEYRALRASVLRLHAAEVQPGEFTLSDVGRFNEAMDQAVAESVAVFAEQVDRWRHLFFGVVQHDLRGPLQAMMNAALLMSVLPPGREREEALARLQRGGDRMTALLNQLLDYNRVALNLGLSIVRSRCDLATVCREEVEMRRMAHPQHRIDCAVSGPTVGQWDASRLQQALGNLISNAAKHGSQGGRIRVECHGAEADVVVVVANDGPAIEPEDAASIFDPLRRSPGSASSDRTHLGLGLFIVREIARAHGGEVGVDSVDGSTRFSMRLPR